jgi:WD40 repeat protein
LHSVLIFRQLLLRNFTSSYKLEKTLEGHDGKINDLVFSPPTASRKMIASAGQDYTVKLWDLDSDKPITLLGHLNRVFGVAFSPDGRIIASGGRDTKLVLWDLDSLNLDNLLTKNCALTKDYLQIDKSMDKRSNHQEKICSS